MVSHSLIECFRFDLGHCSLYQSFELRILSIDYIKFVFGELRTLYIRLKHRYSSIQLDDISERVITDLQHCISLSAVVIPSVIHTYNHMSFTRSDSSGMPIDQDGNLAYLIKAVTSKLCLQLCILVMHTVLQAYDKIRSSIPSTIYPNHFVYDLNVMQWVYTSIATNTKPDYEQNYYLSLNSLEKLWLLKHQISVTEDNEGRTLQDIVLLHYFPDLRTLLPSIRMNDIPYSNRATLSPLSVDDSHAKLVVQSFDIASHAISQAMNMDDLFGYLSIGFCRIHEKMSHKFRPESKDYTLSTQLIVRAYIQCLSYYRKCTLQSISLAVMVPLAISLVDNHDATAQLIGAEALYAMIKCTTSATLLSMLSWLLPKVFHLVEVVPSELYTYRVMCRILLCLLTLSSDSHIILTVCSTCVFYYFVFITA